ncbi:hypothetical protein L1049_006143 [Liquidambar formosana]|uniref:Stress-response A/B barrel domain-containing protein n=1 Tax=Liquidambar formosana TaxID=63359 RepID=A0AAP0WTC1_LIQFO
MLIQAHTLSPSTLHLPHCHRQNPISSPCCFSSQYSESSSRKPYNVLRLNGVKNMRIRRGRNRRAIFSASEGNNPGNVVERKREIVEHICLLKAKENLSDDEEKDMLDYLYTSQYQMGGIVAISLGCILEKNLENYTHAVYMRFQKKEDLAKFYENPFYLGVLKKHVMPYCHGLINVDYKSEVEDDILLIFRKGEEFNYGVEFILLIAFDESAVGEPVEDALTSFARLTMEFPSLIVQSTQGSNFNLRNKEYTHGVVIRFRSLEAFEIFVGSPEYKDVRSPIYLISLFSYAKFCYY